MHKHEEKECARNLSDRRQCPTPIFSRFTLCGGRRKKIRRHSDRHRHIFVDLYSARLFVAVVVLLLLSTLDAFLTLALIERGKVIEANPIMAYILDYGVFHFSLTKFIVTAISLILLCLFKNVNITRIGMLAIMGIYLVVIVYEIYLFMI